MAEKKLGILFDYQRFADNVDLRGMIRDTEVRYPRLLNNEELSFVNAAGIPAMMNIKDQDEKKKNEPWNCH